MKLSLTNWGLQLHYSGQKKYALFYNYGMHVLKIMPTNNGSLGHEAFSLDRPDISDVCLQNSLDLHKYSYAYTGHQQNGCYTFNLDSPAKQKLLI